MGKPAETRAVPKTSVADGLMHGKTRGTLGSLPTWIPWSRECTPSLFSRN